MFLVECAASVQTKLKAMGARIAGVEGRRNGDWVLVDLGGIVILHASRIHHYNLVDEEEVETRSRRRRNRRDATNGKEGPLVARLHVVAVANSFPPGPRRRATNT